MKFNVVASEVAEGVTHIVRVANAAQTLDVSLSAALNRLGDGIQIPKPLLGKIKSTDEFKAYLTRVQREVADLAVAVEQFVNQR
jgi:hypothetical protein